MSIDRHEAVCDVRYSYHLFVWGTYLRIDRNQAALTLIVQILEKNSSLFIEYVSVVIDSIWVEPGKSNTSVLSPILELALSPLSKNNTLLTIYCCMVSQ